MFTCYKCKIEKEDSERTPRDMMTKRNFCRSCKSEKFKAYYENNKAKIFTRRKVYTKTTVGGNKAALIKGARRRAKEKGLPCQLNMKNIPDIPEYCPILKIKLQRGDGQHTYASPSLDRINPKLGYIPGNVQIISYRANMLKNDASLQEIEMLLEWMKSVKVDEPIFESA